MKTNEGELSNRDKEKMIDGNTVTSQYIKGEDAFVEFNWEAMKVNLKNLKFTGELWPKQVPGRGAPAAQKTEC